jgi:2-amino-4-hydroxy-6-hydroxymethyldihydropteridine diphosphokinase
MEKIVLGLGSNRNFCGKNSLEILRGACGRLTEFIVSAEISSVYRTSAMYFQDQDDFLNMVLTGFFDGSAELLLQKIHEIEAEFGRDRKTEIRNGPRTLDIDIEIFGEKKIRTKDLTVPHERLLERKFVLVPFLEVLKKNADVNKADVEFYEGRLSLLTGQEIALFCPREKFFQ